VLLQKEGQNHSIGTFLGVRACLPKSPLKNPLVFIMTAKRRKYTGITTTEGGELFGAWFRGLENVFQKDLEMVRQAAFSGGDGIEIPAHFQTDDVDYLDLAVVHRVVNGVARKNGDAEVVFDGFGDGGTRSQHRTGIELFHVYVLWAKETLQGFPGSRTFLAENEGQLQQSPGGDTLVDLPPAGGGKHQLILHEGMVLQLLGFGGGADKSQQNFIAKHCLHHLGGVRGPYFIRYFRMERSEVGGQTRQDVGAGNGAGGNGNCAGNIPADRGELVFKFFQVVENCQGAWIEEVCFESGDDGSAESVKKPAVEAAFEITDVFADSRLAGVELFGGPGEALVCVDGDENFEVSSFYLEPPVLNLFQVREKHGI